MCIYTCLPYLREGVANKVCLLYLSVAALARAAKVFWHQGRGR